MSALELRCEEVLSTFWGYRRESDWFGGQARPEEWQLEW